ncbi:EpsG family protein [Bacteroides fragilis]
MEFFLIFDVNGLRQGLAIGFILYSCKFIFSRNIWGFLFMIILATLSHSSAIVFFSCLFFAKHSIFYKEICDFLFNTFFIRILGFFMCW